MNRFLQSDYDRELKRANAKILVARFCVSLPMYHLSIQQRLMLSANCSKANCGKSSTPGSRAANTVIPWPHNFSGCFYADGSNLLLAVNHLKMSICTPDQTPIPSLPTHHQNCCSLPLYSSTESIPSSIIDITKPLYKTRLIYLVVIDTSTSIHFYNLP